MSNSINPAQSEKVSAKSRRRTDKWLLAAGLMLVSASAFAAATNLGGLATNVTGSFESVVKLITAVCYVAGVGFAAAGIMKFKQHKDNPTQVPLGGPVAMIFIAAALIWLPGIIGATGGTVFGDNSTNANQRGSAVGTDPFPSSSSGG